MKASAKKSPFEKGEEHAPQGGIKMRNFKTPPLPTLSQGEGLEGVLHLNHFHAINTRNSHQIFIATT